MVTSMGPQASVIHCHSNQLPPRRCCCQHSPGDNGGGTLSSYLGESQPMQTRTAVREIGFVRQTKTSNTTSTKQEIKSECRDFSVAAVDMK